MKFIRPLKYRKCDDCGRVKATRVYAVINTKIDEFEIKKDLCDSCKLEYCEDDSVIDAK